MPLRAYLSTRGDVAALRLFAVVVGGRWVLGMEKGHIGAFGGPAWWKEERLPHGVLWLMYACTGDDTYLKVDTAFGALNWLINTTTSGLTHA